MMNSWVHFGGDANWQKVTRLHRAVPRARFQYNNGVVWDIFNQVLLKNQIKTKESQCKHGEWD